MTHRGRCRSQGSFYFEFGFYVDFNDILYHHEYHDDDHDHGDHVEDCHDDDDNHGIDDGDDHDDNGHEDDNNDNDNNDDNNDNVLRWKQYGFSLMTPLLPRVKISSSQSLSQR